MQHLLSTNQEKVCAESPSVLRVSGMWPAQRTPHNGVIPVRQSAGRLLMGSAFYKVQN